MQEISKDTTPRKIATIGDHRVFATLSLGREGERLVGSRHRTGRNIR